MKCDVCNSLENEIKTIEFNTSIKDKEIKYTAERRVCKKCGSYIYDKDLDNKALQKAFSVYNEKYGIPGRKIREFRKKFNLSLDLLARIIGCAKKTLISYEKEISIPNDTYMLCLKMLLGGDNYAKKMIELAKDSFSEKEYNLILSKFSENSGLNMKQIKEEEIELNEYNGYTELSVDKFRNIILILAETGITKTKLLKELFYCDNLHYKKTTCSITGFAYAKLPYGPVPDDFNAFLETFTENKIIINDIKYSKDKEINIITSNKKIDYSLFDDAELKVIKYIKEYFKDFNTEEIINFSHEEKSFKETKENEIISYDLALDLNIDIDL